MEDINIEDINIEKVVINQPIILEEGKTYAIEFDHIVGDRIRDNIRRKYEGYGNKFNVKFFILDPGLSFSRTE